MGYGSLSQRFREHAAEWNMAEQAARRIGDREAAISAEARKETWSEAAQAVDSAADRLPTSAVGSTDWILVACPRPLCGAKPLELCWDLRSRPASLKAIHPHRERRMAARAARPRSRAGDGGTIT